MTGNLARVDLFTPVAGVDADVLAGLARLEDGAPLWGDRLEWIELVTALRGFEEQWGGVARPAGWSLVALYGLDPVAPRARVQRMGAAFLASLRAHRVIAVDANAITVVTRTSGGCAFTAARSIQAQCSPGRLPSR
jgi:hypothetical protein